MFVDGILISHGLRLPTERKLVCLSTTGGCTGLSESTLVRIPYCWKSHIVAQKINTKMSSAVVLVGAMNIGESFQDYS